MSSVASASSITTVAATGSHVLKINGYSASKLAMTCASPGKSCQFEAAGHTWCILHYPNGYDYEQYKEVADHISLYLRLAGNAAAADVVVKATFRFTLVAPHRSGAEAMPNKPPQVVPYHRQSPSAVSFRHRIPQGFPCFIRREVLEKSEYLVDDSFVVRCDIDSFAVWSDVDEAVRCDIESFAAVRSDIDEDVETSAVDMEVRTTCCSPLSLLLPCTHPA